MGSVAVDVEMSLSEVTRQALRTNQWRILRCFVLPHKDFLAASENQKGTVIDGMLD